MQRDWRVFTPRPGFYDEVAEKYRAAMEADDRVVLVAENEGEVVGMAYAEIRIPSFRYWVLPSSRCPSARRPSGPCATTEAWCMATTSQ